MCRIATTELAPRLQASAKARDFLRPTLARWGLAEDSVEQALLMTSEAVTNAAVHAGTVSGLTVSLAGSCVEIAVSDLFLGVDDVRPETGVRGPARRGDG